MSSYPELRARGDELESRVLETRARYQELETEIRPLNELVRRSAGVAGCEVGSLRWRTRS